MYDYANHKDFHTDDTYDANVTQSLLERQGMTSFRPRKSSTIKNRNGNYTIEVIEKIIIKGNGDGENYQFFEVYGIAPDGTTFPKVKKSYKDFKSFQVSLGNRLKPEGLEVPVLDGTLTEKLMPSSDKLFSNFSVNGSDRNEEEQLENIKNFCGKLSREKIFQKEEFLDFFGLPQNFYDGNQPDRLSVVTQSIEDDGYEERERENSSFGAAKWSHFKNDNMLLYCYYFDVRLVDIEKSADHDSFVFKIQSLKIEDIRFNLAKRYSDFDALSQFLKKNCQSKPPQLPSKIIRKDQGGLEKRANQLLNFLLTVLNEKMFHQKKLFEFIDLPSRYVNEHISYKPIDFIYNNYDLKVNIKDYEHSKIQGTSDQFIAYTIRIEVFNAKGLKNIISCFEVKRRYKEFHELNEILKRRFKKYQNSLPELPGKLKYHGDDVRKIKLEQYLKRLLDYPNIIDIIPFRQFLQIKPDRFREYQVNRTRLFMSQVWNLDNN